MSFFREQKLLAALLVISLLVLVAGLVMIQLSHKQAVQKDDAMVEDQKKTIATMNLIADMAEQGLQEQQNQPAVQGIGDIKPHESLDRVAALNGRIPDIGSDDWCEVMMVKDASDWTTDEQAIFAKHCL